jgi:hypothetical protein
MTEETTATAAASTERPALPDHLSTDERSPHFVRAIFEHDVGIRFNDKGRFTNSPIAAWPGRTPRTNRTVINTMKVKPPPAGAELHGVFLCMNNNKHKDGKS